MPRTSRRRPKAEWLLSEVAPFIRRILKKWATDEDRTAVAREFADWLAANGDRGGHAEWFRHPKLRWEHYAWGIGWTVHPWDNGGYGRGARIDNDWWTQYYPTRAYVESPAAERLVAAWFENGVEFERYTWTREVAARLGRLAEYDRRVSERLADAERRRRDAVEDAIRERAAYVKMQRDLVELHRTYAVRFTDGAGI